VLRLIHQTAFTQLWLLAAAGAPIADPLIGLVITLVILRITWESWGTVRGRDHHHQIVGRHAGPMLGLAAAG
jgi:hypothetical protein